MSSDTQKRRADFTVGNLLGRRIVAADGTSFGRVADIQLTERSPYVVIALLRGRWGLLHRLHVLNPFTERHSRSHKPARIPWEAVERIERERIVLNESYPLSS